jgi:deazaflavin-dependent oxidoreductase (nitroreductase family)
MVAEREYKALSPFEQRINRLLLFFAGIGLAPSYVQILEVRGRKSGKLYSTPVSVVEHAEQLFLVAPRGRTQWARNAEAAGEIVLRKRSSRRKYHLRPLADAEKPEVLKKYLTSYKGAVQRFFPVQPDAPREAFAEIAAGYPVFELRPD